MSSANGRAVFLDRDGVLNRAIVRDGKPYPPKDLSEFVIVPGAREELQRLKDLGFKLIVVTNQPDIGRGTQDRSAVDELNDRLRRELPIDEIIVCPHDDKDNCDCRKPRPGSLLRAAEKYHLDLSRSFMVGDRWRDIDAGHAAGCKTVFIDFRYNERGPTKAAEFRVGSLSDAVKSISEAVRSEEQVHERG